MAQAMDLDSDNETKRPLTAYVIGRDRRGNAVVAYNGTVFTANAAKASSLQRQLTTFFIGRMPANITVDREFGDVAFDEMIRTMLAEISN